MARIYVTKKQLEDEIILSKIKYRESNYPVTPAECFTPNLTKYLKMIVDKYASKGNWRNYCVDEGTECLTQRGWLNIDEITTDDIILSCKNGQLKWSKIISIYRGNFDGKLFKLTVQGFDALVTPGHKFITTEGLKKVENLREKDKIVLIGTATDAPDQPTYEDAFVELVGWTITEGSYYSESCRKYSRVTISQNEGKYSTRIRKCLSVLNERYSEHNRLNPSGNTNVIFHLTKNLCEKMVNIAPRKVPTISFILSLTQAQRELLINTMIDADGWRQHGKFSNYCQCDKKQIDIFLMLCTIAGYRTTTKFHDPIGFGKKPIHLVRILSKRHSVSVVEYIDFHGSKNSNRIIGKDKSLYPNKPCTDYKGRVWCPETEYGSFVARRNGSIYLTGNSYVDDMKSDAMVILCQNCFKYDETRFSNPFGYITQIVKYCFITSLEKEELMRDIKDSLWESIGMTPSYARQIKNEMLRDVTDQSNKGMKAIKKDADVINAKINLLSDIIFKMKKIRVSDLDLDLEISQALEIEPLPFTSDLDTAIKLFVNPPQYVVETDIKIAGQKVNCLTLLDATTKSNTKRVISDVEDATVIIALCSIALTIRRDMLVKKVRDISGHNITSTRMPTADKMITNDDYETETSYETKISPKRRIPIKKV